MSTIASTGGGESTGGGGTSGGSTAAAAGWGDDWRQRIAGTDAEELKRLERFQGPENIYKSYRELESRMSKGEIRPVLPKNATPEEATRWRAEMGIPAKPEDYKITGPEGKPPPKEDDAFIKSFLKSAHEANYTQAQVDAEKAAETATDEALRKEWGADYRVNKQMAEALLARAPAGFRDRFMNGYLADHTPIKASPEAWKWLTQMEREINPAATVVPGRTGDLGKTIADELIELKKLMPDQNSRYWKGPEAETLQARYRQLVEADAKLKAKAA